MQAAQAQVEVDRVARDRSYEAVREVRLVDLAGGDRVPHAPDPAAVLGRIHAPLQRADRFGAARRRGGGCGQLREDARLARLHVGPAVARLLAQHQPGRATNLVAHEEVGVETADDQRLSPGLGRQRELLADDAQVVGQRPEEAAPEPRRQVVPGEGPQPPEVRAQAEEGLGRRLGERVEGEQRVASGSAGGAVQEHDATVVAQARERLVQPEPTGLAREPPDARSKLPAGGAVLRPGTFPTMSLSRFHAIDPGVGRAQPTRCP